MKLDTADDVRRFLRLCLDPGPGRRGRTPEQLACVMPDWLTARVDEHAPHLTELRTAQAKAEQALAKAQVEYAAALKTWIDGTDTEGTA